MIQTQNLILSDKSQNLPVTDKSDLQLEANRVISKLAVLSSVQEFDIAKLQVQLPTNNNKPSTPPTNGPSTGVPSWAQMKKAMIQAKLQEILAELQAIQESGGDYPIAYIITVVMGALKELSTELQEVVAKPLEHYQEISRRQAILQQRIEAIKKKQLEGKPITEEDAKGFLEAVRDLDKAVDNLKKEFTFIDDDGNEVVKWPSDEVKDIYEKARKNTDMILNEKVTSSTLRDLDPNNPSHLRTTMTALEFWAEGANRQRPGPIRAFVEWDNGKGGAQGNTLMKIILDTEISTYTDRLNRDAQLIASAQSMGQKQVEHASSLMRAVVANFISR